MDVTMSTLDQHILDATLTYRGIVTYERGFEIVEIEGWVREESGWVVVYGNPDAAPHEQRRTAVLKSRVIEVDLLLS